MGWVGRAVCVAVGSEVGVSVAAGGVGVGRAVSVGVAATAVGVFVGVGGLEEAKRPNRKPTPAITRTTNPPSAAHAHGGKDHP